MAYKGDAKAQYELAVYYYYESYSNENDATTVYWFTEAANQGYAEAQDFLGDYSIEAIWSNKMISSR